MSSMYDNCDLLLLMVKIQVREIIGAESVEVSRYKAKMEKRAR